MACLGVAPDVYFIDYNTKRDYQTANESTKRSEKVASKQGLSQNGRTASGATSKR